MGSVSQTDQTAPALCQQEAGEPGPTEASRSPLAGGKTEQFETVAASQSSASECSCTIDVELLPEKFEQRWSEVGRLGFSCRLKPSYFNTHDDFLFVLHRS